jgi:hypothetical protein
LNEQQRRDRLAAAWQALGGQSPDYIQTTLRANGFDVYVHEWWVPGTEPPVGVNACAVPRNPLLYLRRESTNETLGVECGEPLAACGEGFAQAGNGVQPRGYPLVNRIRRTTREVLNLCGEPLVECGEPSALAGDYETFTNEYVDYIVPADSAKWPFFLYIGAENINGVAQIDANRKEEFEALCLKICPAHLWLGIIVEYT